MLTARQNFIETVRGGKPDRYVNQYEAISLLFHPYFMFYPGLVPKGEVNVVNAWGVTNSYPEHTPGMFPVHTPDKIVIKDIENWRDYVKAPSLKFTDEQWGAAKGMYDAVDNNLAFKAVFVAPGLFEQTHHLGEIQNALCYYYEYPEEMHELIKYLMEWELELAEGICKNLKPDMLFHHDDWGTEINSFMNPDMFAEFFVEPYKQIYKYYKDNGVEFVVHHSDSYAANLVPHMIEMGIDVWQGCMYSNNVPEMIKKYGGKISFMGGIDNKFVDFDGWTQEDCKKAARKLIDECGGKYYIPCITQGGPGSNYPGTYMALSEEIDNYNVEKFGLNKSDIEKSRLPLQVMF